MLGVCDQVELAPPEWETIALQAELPATAAEFFSRQGATPIMPDTQRGYHRMFLRTHAVLRYQGEYYAAYLADISRSGVGFVSPVQLLPCEAIDVWIQDGRHLTLLTKRCIRLGPNCYNCGAVFK